MQKRTKENISIIVGGTILSLGSILTMFIFAPLGGEMQIMATIGWTWLSLFISSELGVFD